MRFIRLMHTPERFLLLSDGIFAIALTLMAADVVMPEHLTSPEVVRQLGEWVHRVFVYLLSFYMLARYWVAHIARFDYVRMMDRTFMALSLASLAIVAMVPPTTAMISDYPDDSNIVTIYMGTMAILGLVDFAALVYLSRTGDLFKREIPQSILRFWIRMRLVFPSVALGCLVIARANPRIAIFVFFFLIALFDLFIRKPESTEVAQWAE